MLAFFARIGRDLKNFPDAAWMIELLRIDDGFEFFYVENLRDYTFVLEKAWSVH